MKFILVIGLVMFAEISCTVPASLSYSKLAGKFYEDGDYANAIQYYMKAVAHQDLRAETFYWLGMSYHRHGDWEEAMLALERSLEKDSTDVAVLERLAAVHLDLDNFERARFYCRKAISLDSEYVETYNTLGHVYSEEGSLDTAEYCFRYALTLSKSLRWQSVFQGSFASYSEHQAEANNGLGELCISRGLLYRALDYFSAANSLAHNWETPWFNKGRVYEALGNTRAAEISYKRTIDLAPRNTWAFKNLARLYRSLGRSSEAMTIYLRAWRVDTTDVDIYFGLAELYQEKGDNGTAADLCSRAIDQAPDDPKAYARAGRAYLLIRNYEQAIELLSEAVQLQPESADAHNALGEGYRASGDTVQAQRSFEEAIALDSLFTLPLRNFGEMLLKQGKDQEALQLYVRAARLGDEKAAAYLRSRGLRGE